MGEQDNSQDLGKMYRWPATTSPTRRALDILEILDTVLSSGDFSRCDYAAFAQVNTLWNYLALKRVWHTLEGESLHYLFQLLAPLVRSSDDYGKLVSTSRRYGVIISTESINQRRSSLGAWSLQISRGPPDFADMQR